MEILQKWHEVGIGTLENKGQIEEDNFAAGMIVLFCIHVWNS